jgi:hypothetical protein
VIDPNGIASSALPVDRSPTGAHSPLVSFGNGVFGVAWADDRGSRFAVTDSSGQRIGDSVPLPLAAPTFEVWAGADYALISGFDLMRVNADRVVTLSPRRILEDVTDRVISGVTPIPDGLAILLSTATGSLQIERVTLDGVRAHPPITVVEEGSASYGASMVWTGYGFGVLYGDRLMRFDEFGRRLGDALVPPVAPGIPLLWNGGSFLLGGSHLYSIDSLGQIVGRPSVPEWRVLGRSEAGGAPAFLVGWE